MNSIPFLDDRYPVRTVYTDSADWQRHAGWQQLGTRNAALQDYLRTPLKRVAYAPVAHLGNVLAVSDGSGGYSEGIGETGPSGLAGECDALATATPEVMLCIWTADCLPLFLYDPEQHTAALAHCGWRNICNRIVPNTVEVMAGHFGTNPQNVIAAFGPGICGNCYEVGDELTVAFSQRFSPDEVSGLFAPKANGKFLLDLRKAVSLELCRMGVELENIHDVGICSYESEAHSSYRRNGPSEFGRQTLSGIVLT